MANNPIEEPELDKEGDVIYPDPENVTILPPEDLVSGKSVSSISSAPAPTNDESSGTNYLPDETYHRLIDEKDGQIRNLEMTRDSLQVSVAEVQANVNTLRGENTRLARENLQLQRDLIAATGANAELVREKDEALREKNDASALLTDARRAVRSATVRATTAEGRVNELQTARNELAQANAALTEENRRLNEKDKKKESTVKKLQYGIATALVALSVSAGIGEKAGEFAAGSRSINQISQKDKPKDLKEALGLDENVDIKPIPGDPTWYNAATPPSRVPPIVKGYASDDRYEFVTKEGDTYVSDIGVKYAGDVHYRFYGPEGELYDYTVKHYGEPDSTKTFSEIVPAGSE